MEDEVVALEDMNCWNVVHRQHNAHVLHSNFVLKPKRNEFGNVKFHKARVIICSNEENEYEENCFPPVPDDSVI